MTPLMWIVVAVGVVLWGWLLVQVVSSDGYFDRQPCTCGKGARCLVCIERDGLTKP